MATSDRPLPNFLIIGAMRSGTTALTRYLDAHPQVFMAPEKEVHFFDRHYDRGVEWYRSRFAGANGEWSIGEATQTYMFLPDVLPRIAATIPDVRMVAILRDPVDRAYSHYWMNRSMRTESRDPRPALSEGLRPSPGAKAPLFPYLERGHYLAQLERVCELFPRESLHVLLFEDLIARPGETFGAVCSFLGIDTTQRPANLGSPVNQHIEYRSIGVRTLSKRLPKPLANVIGKLNGKLTGYPAIDPELRADLAEHFAAHNAKLAAWLGRDLGAWDPR